MLSEWAIASWHTLEFATIGTQDFISILLSKMMFEPLLIFETAVTNVALV